MQANIPPIGYLMELEEDWILVGINKYYYDKNCVRTLGKDHSFDDGRMNVTIPKGVKFMLNKLWPISKPARGWRTGAKIKFVQDKNGRGPRGSKTIDISTLNLNTMKYIMLEKIPTEERY